MKMIYVLLVGILLSCSSSKIKESENTKTYKVDSTFRVEVNNEDVTEKCILYLNDLQGFAWNQNKVNLEKRKNVELETDKKINYFNRIECDLGRVVSDRLSYNFKDDEFVFEIQDNGIKEYHLGSIHILWDVEGYLSSQGKSISGTAILSNVLGSGASKRQRRSNKSFKLSHNSKDTKNIKVQISPKK